MATDVLGSGGTQTGLDRPPASFCGVFGHKPPRASPRRILPFAAASSPGAVARCVADLAILYETISKRHYASYEYLAEAGSHLPHGEPQASTTLVKPPTLGVPRPYNLSMADPEMQRALDAVLATLQAAGAKLIELAMPEPFEDVRRCHRAVMASEGAFGHRDRFREHPDAYLPRISELIREGLATSAPDYLYCRAHQHALTESLPEFFLTHGIDALITPATIGAAPDLSTTGDPALNAPWSYTGSPALSIPFTLSSGGLPLALQLVGEHRKEFALFKTAIWCEDVIRSTFESRKD